MSVISLVYANHFLLSLINACFLSVIFGFVFLAGILTQKIAPEVSWSTVPITSYVIGAAVFIVPISMLMETRGRRLGFLVGAIFGCLASLAIYLAGNFGSFSVMCVAGFFIGGLTASAGFLRFAGLELSEPENHGIAASIVLSGGIVASFFGTNFPLLIKDIAKVELFNALSISVLFLSAISLLFILFLPKMQNENGQKRKSPRSVIFDISLFKKTQFTQGVAACAGGYAVMTLLMNAAPLYVTNILELPIEVAEKVMRNHFLAMFVPFLFSGFLLDRFNANRLTISGVVLNVISIIIFLSGSSEIHLYGALITLGIGWNFVFLGGTTILQSSLTQNKLHIGQRMNELILDGGNAVASAAVGALIHTLGLTSLLIIASIICILILVLFLQRKEIMHEQ